MRSCQGWVLAFSLFVASAAGADPGPNVRFADGGMSMVAITDRFRSASLHIGLEMGHTLRWGGFLELGALWPRRTPDIFASGGPLLGIGASFAVQFADAAAFLVTSGVAASSRSSSRSPTNESGPRRPRSTTRSCSSPSASR
jgi:hypothetical protein